MEQAASKKTILSWALFDWANSAFTTIILTFVYGTYFTKSVAPDETTGSAYWGYAIAASGILLLVLSPLSGALADHTGRLKKWIAFSTLFCVCGALLLSVAGPQSSLLVMLIALLGLVIGNIGFEQGQIFYNALLTNIATIANTGRISALGWGLGYAGGLASLFLVLFGLIGLGDLAPWFDLPKDNSWHIRACAIFVAVWFIVFSVPLFFWVTDKPRTSLPLREAYRRALNSLKENFAYLALNRNWRDFLIGSALYRDGLNTLFAFGGIYAAVRYNLETPQILLFGIGMNVTAGLGCLISAFIEDRIGSMKIIRVSILCLMLFGFLILFTQTAVPFFVLALILGLFIGPLQSASRSVVARLSESGNIGGNFGFYALTGRAASFIGPLFYGVAIHLFSNQNAGLAVILILWFAGLLFVRKLKT